MWIMFPSGVVSIVEKHTDRGNDTLTVRSRDKKSLAAFCTLATGHEVKPKNIKFKMLTDYPYRRVLPRAQVEAAAAECVRNIDYSNFKNEAKRVRGAAFAGVLGRVWSAVLELEDKATRDQANARWKDTPLLGAAYSSPQGSVIQPGDDDWDAILPDDLTAGEAEELEELDDIVKTMGVQALTDSQWARYEALGG